ncbi:MAG TPA: 4'-phosphopantetheinyl transferase superfamily protein [Acidimicrobiales bacterium]|nr:4'-phosphopantetheinyl transferase superfamily protein [Acidimicrobiales bacterium]
MESVDVWLVDLRGVEASTDALSDEERERASRMRLDEPRRRFLASHMALRAVLSQYVERIDLQSDVNGKPHLAGREICFNLSHSGELAAVAVAGQEIGVDVQEVRALYDAEALARRILSPAEAGSDILGAWTRKEAVVKATGEGIRRSLTEVQVYPPAGPWWVEDLDVPDGYVGAVAGLGPRPRIDVRRWCWE